MSWLISTLVSSTGLSEFDIRSIIRNAPLRYKTYSIPKRSGGEREISQPARELKALQRALVECLLIRLPIHDSATAYRSGKSIRDNAIIHVNNGPILKFDFKNFFPSLTGKDWISYCERHTLFGSQEDVYMSAKILFRQARRGSALRLAIGAPSSPLLSNILMYEFDCKISETVARDHVVYSRYADDLTFSARRTGFLVNVERDLVRTLHEIKWPRLVLNSEKTTLATRKFKRMVTGLVLTNDGKVSLGHERKKLIRAAVHHAKSKKLDDLQLQKLKGLLAFANDVEPDFVERLARKYGADVLSAIKGSLHLTTPSHNDHQT